MLPLQVSPPRAPRRTTRLLACLCGLSLLVSCSTTPSPPPSLPPTPPIPEPPPGPVLRTEYGLASWYGEAHQGRRTASGEPFDKDRLTAAHRSAPFHAQAVVTNLHNGRTVRVRINDRGPYSAGRIIDLSEAAALALDMLRAGVVRVKVELLGFSRQTVAVELDSAE